ncbi:MAG: DNA pilot protein [Microviridae sp.]|nr:MAG: DNA pilot protein [Microviridae sp.]
MFILDFMAKKKNEWIGGAIQGGAAVVSSVVDGLFANKKAKAQYKYDKLLQEQAQAHADQQATTAFERQLEFYDRQKNDQQAYNDPQAVRERYQNAGINPNAAFGTAGSYTPQNVPSAPSVAQGATLPPVQGYSPLGNFDPMDSILKAATIGKTIAETLKTQGDTKDPNETKRGQKLLNDLTDANLIDKQTEIEQNAFNLAFDKAVAETRKESIRQSLENLRREGDLLNAQYRETMTSADKNEEDIKLINSQILVNDARIALMQQKEKLDKAMTAKAWQEVSNLQDQLLTNVEVRRELAGRVRLYKSEYENNMQDAALKKRYQAAVKLENAIKELDIENYDQRLEIADRDSRSRRIQAVTGAIAEAVNVGVTIGGAAVSGGASLAGQAAVKEVYKAKYKNKR